MPAAPLHAGEIAAIDARRQLRIDATAPLRDIVTAVETGGGVPVFLLPLPGEIAGLAQRQDGRWYVAADSTDSAGRLRFTVGHEFGHICLGHDPAIDDDRTLRAFEPGDDPREVAANYFAAEFLLPRNAVEDAFAAAGGPADCVDLIYQLAERAGTTRWVPYYRLCTLDLIPRAARASHKERLKARAPVVNQVSDTVAGYAKTERTRRPVAHVERLRRALDRSTDFGE